MQNQSKGRENPGGQRKKEEQCRAGAFEIVKNLPTKQSFHKRAGFVRFALLIAIISMILIKNPTSRIYNMFAL